MTVATDFRAEFQDMIAIGDAAISRGIGADLIDGPSAVRVREAARSLEARVIEQETSEGLHWDGLKHIPLPGLSK